MSNVEGNEELMKEGVPRAQSISVAEEQLPLPPDDEGDENESFATANESDLELVSRPAAPTEEKEEDGESKESPSSVNSSGKRSVISWKGQPTRTPTPPNATAIQEDLEKAVSTLSRSDTVPKSKKKTEEKKSSPPVSDAASQTTAAASKTAMQSRREPSKSPRASEEQASLTEGAPLPPVSEATTANKKVAPQATSSCQVQEAVAPSPPVPKTTIADKLIVPELPTTHTNSASKQEPSATTLAHQPPQEAAHVTHDQIKQVPQPTQPGVVGSEPAAVTGLQVKPSPAASAELIQKLPPNLAVQPPQPGPAGQSKPAVSVKVAPSKPVAIQPPQTAASGQGKSVSGRTQIVRNPFQPAAITTAASKNASYYYPAPATQRKEEEGDPKGEKEVEEEYDDREEISLSPTGWEDYPPCLRTLVEIYFDRYFADDTNEYEQSLTIDVIIQRLATEFQAKFVLLENESRIIYKGTALVSVEKTGKS